MKFPFITQPSLSDFCEWLIGGDGARIIPGADMPRYIWQYIQFLKKPITIEMLSGKNKLYKGIKKNTKDYALIWIDAKYTGFYIDSFEGDDEPIIPISELEGQPIKEHFFNFFKP